MNLNRVFSICLLVVIAFSLSACQNQSLKPTIAPMPTLSPPPPIQDDQACAKAGCSGQLCVDVDLAPQIMTDCEFKPEYACYQTAVCEKQDNGQCGFTQTPELKTCLQKTGTISQPAN